MGGIDGTLSAMTRRSCRQELRSGLPWALHGIAPANVSAKPASIRLRYIMLLERGSAGRVACSGNQVLNGCNLDLIAPGVAPTAARTSRVRWLWSAKPVSKASCESDIDPVARRVSAD